MLPVVIIELKLIDCEIVKNVMFVCFTSEKKTARLSSVNVDSRALQKITSIIKDFISIFNFIIEQYKLLNWFIMRSITSCSINREMVKERAQHFCALLFNIIHNVFSTKMCSNWKLTAAFLWYQFYWLTLASIIQAHDNRTNEL